MVVGLVVLEPYRLSHRRRLQADPAGQLEEKHNNVEYLPGVVASAHDDVSHETNQYI
jgi:hypothetical protein